MPNDEAPPMPAPQPPPVPSPAPRGAERRQHLRARADWPLSVRLGADREEVKLRDLSAAGACFFHDRAIPEMTLLELAMELPGPGPSAPRAIVARGAVVRCQQISPRVEHFEIAVFLHDIRDDDRRALAEWVRTQANAGDGREAEFRV